MWRLGKKYGFEELRDDAARRLQHLYPSSLKEFQSCWYTPGSTTSSYIQFYPEITFDVINLARETGFVSILPAALYLACSIGQEHKAIQSNIMKARLSDVDKALCILATTDLLHKQWELPYGWLAASEAECVNHQCRSAREVVKAALGFPITSMVALKPAQTELRGYPCSRCVARRDAGFKPGQGALWTQLPAIFSLPSWDEIAKEMERCVFQATFSGPSESLLQYDAAGYPPVTVRSSRFLRINTNIPTLYPRLPSLLSPRSCSTFDRLASLSRRFPTRSSTSNAPTIYL